ncbi:MAG: hypothetical protein MUE96_09240 [Bacteroidia bacterium]|jgi:hypothetical protein|nr:hypothetical protein [Bacteroidia bacterium]
MKNPVIKNILAVVLGLVGGSILNMGILNIGSFIIPPPEGADLNTMEGLKASMHLMGPEHFVMPFLAHALGTLLGAWIALKVANNGRYAVAIIVGMFFLLGGIINVIMLPSPVWFTILDLVFGYLPMVYLATLLVQKKV